MAELKRALVPEVSEIRRKILSFFFAFPDCSIGLTDLAGKISSSKNSVRLAVLQLGREGLLHKEEIGKSWRISTVSKNPRFIAKKIAYHLGLLYESLIYQSVYMEVPHARAIIFFGSCRWGTDNEKSDIDLAVEILGNQGLRIKPLGVIKRFGFRKNVKVNLHIFSRTSVDLNLFTNIANGIVLDGLLEAHP